MNKFWNFIKNEATETKDESIELHIKGDIIDDSQVWLYEWFDEQATAPNLFKDELSQYKGKDLTIVIDSYGGDLFAGASMYNALKEHNGKITAKIEIAMSAASVIAMAADEILMSPVGVMMIHNPLTTASGNMHDLRKVANVLDEVKELIINAYVTKTGRSRAKISQMMDDETWMSANVAVKEGFADGVLYQDNMQVTNEVHNFSFNRLAVMNNANQSVQNAIDLMNVTVTQNDEYDQILLELDLI